MLNTIPLNESALTTLGFNTRVSSHHTLIGTIDTEGAHAMVQRMQVFDDFDSSPDAQTVRYGYGDHTYEIDLSAEHQAEFDKVMTRYIEHSRRVDEVQPQPRQRRGRRTETERRSPQELQAIRQWAREQGHTVSDRGRIAAGIIANYDAAH